MLSSLSLNQILILSYVGYLVLMSIITFFLYLGDKKKAVKGKYRTKEKTLLLFSFFGGAFGGYPSMLIFRHKTKGEHWYFTFVNILGILIHSGLLFVCFYYFYK